MPNEPLMPTLDEMDAREAAASEKLNALCNGERFRMSIPVSPTDADVVIGNALNDLRLAIAMIRERDAEIARLKADTEKTHKEAKRSLDRMLEVLRPFAPKGVGTIAPITAEWQIVDEDSCEAKKGHLLHATEPFTNAAFIAAARTDVPALVAAVRERDAEIARLQEYAGLLERGLGAHEARATVWIGLREIGGP